MIDGLRRWRAAVVVVSGGLLLWALEGCYRPQRPQPREVRIAGSDTMLLLTRRWSEEFMRRHPDVVVSVAGGGTGSGVEQLLEGRVSICAGSRPLMAEEVRRIYDRHRALGVSFRCAKDALGVYVNPSNPVRDLTRPELKAVFTGDFRSWDEVGGAAEPIQVLIRQPNSGSYRLFQELVLAEEPYSRDATTLPTTAAIVETVRHDPHAIGYGGLAYAEQALLCRVDGVDPTPANVRSNRYPLARYLFLHTLRPPRGWARLFVDWTLSSEGQALARETGYVPLWETSVPGGGMRDEGEPLAR